MKHNIEILDRYGISTESTVREAMRRLNDLSGETMTLFVTDPCGRICGSITDGDIRRALIKDIELGDKVEKVMNPNFLSATSEDVPAKIAEGRKRGIELLPVIEGGKLQELINIRTTRTRLPLEAVIMAGGRGERLRPLTDTVPKPLLPVAGKPIIDYNIEELEACGIKKIHVTVNYLGEMIKQHFNSRKNRASIECVSEPKRLGTFGSLAYVEGVETENIIIMNSDLLTAVDFESMFRLHSDSGADFTIGSVPYTVSVPFAIMRTKGDNVLTLEEKPTYNYFANGGVYIMRSDLIGRIKKGDYLDAPDFICGLIRDKCKVKCYHINGTWIDIGSTDDYHLANELANELASRKN